jgi:tripartite-type tricarboxylate transporter receptor subunit TctC
MGCRISSGLYAVALAGEAMQISTYAFPQTRPARLARIVVPCSPGGTSSHERVLSAVFHENTGEPFIAEDRAGASGLIGAQLVALARLRHGLLDAGIGVPGSTVHRSAEMRKQMAKLDAAFVPYKGGGPALTALMSGEIDYLFTTKPVASAARRSDRVRLLIVTTAKPASAFPGLPTIITFYPGFESDQGWAMWFPAAMPGDIVAKMYGLIVNALTKETVRDFMQKEGLDPVGSTAEALDAQAKREIAK